MDEFPEKSGSGNLPRHKLPCWNEEMTPSKAELSTGTSPTRGSDARRTNDREERELGLAMSDALADILRAEKEPRQRRSVS